MNRVAVFIGTRPEAIKLAPVVKAIARTPGLEPVVVSTGQHREMLRQVTELFDLQIDHDLDVMRPNQTLASLTGRLVDQIDGLLATIDPIISVVQGDTATTFCAALASFYRRVPIAHVEAGLRTGNMEAPFPEEANRRLTSPLCAMHFPPTGLGEANLLNEGISPESVAVVGNTVIDALMLEAERQSTGAGDEIEQRLAQAIGEDWLTTPSVLITGHRRENFGQGFANICSGIAQLADRHPDHLFVYPVHLNPNVQGPVREHLSSRSNIRLIDPQDYSSFVALMRRAHVILTDSGGVQEEAPSLGKPVLVMRETTERPEGVHAGVARLVGADSQRIVDGVSELLTSSDAYDAISRTVNPYGDGHASDRIAAAISAWSSDRDGWKAALGMRSDWSPAPASVRSDGQQGPNAQGGASGTDSQNSGLFVPDAPNAIGQAMPERRTRSA